MLVGVMADTHDRLPQIRRALAEFERRRIGTVIHAGDICSPFAAKLLAGFEGTLHVIYGNNDGEHEGLRQVLPQIADAPLRLELGGCNILVHHYIGWCDQGDVDRAHVIIGGHSHEIVNELRDGKLHLNPGECCGWLANRSTVAVLDTSARSAETVELDLG